MTTLSFDIAGLELWLPLTVGAQVVIARSETAREGKSLLALLEQSKATLLQATPVTWRLLLEAGWAGNPRLKALCGGEAWGRELAEALLPKCASLWNMYGPTETTIWSAATKVEKGQPPLIGPPIANTQFYVLDARLQPVPIGVAGELHIGGEGLARGYINRPELTQAKFIADPFHTQAKARLYKTGDVARYLPGGQIEFLGRMDHQVKIRGFRIELGEIEAVLGQHPAVREAAVIASEGPGGDKRLVAYVVAREEKATSIDELRGFLKQKLPDYMVPSVFMRLPTLPLHTQWRSWTGRHCHRQTRSVRKMFSPAPRGRWNCNWPRSGKKSSGGNASAFAIIFLTSAGIRCWPCGSSRRWTN